MSSSNKSKNHKIQEQSQQIKKHEKKHKSKKKKKNQHNQSSKKNEQDKPQSTKQSLKESNSIRQEKRTQNIPIKTVTTPDPITQQLSQLQYDGFLSPNSEKCIEINSRLEQLTINLYQTMIMKSSLLKSAILLAKQLCLTPKQYFALDYTNKLQLIKKICLYNGKNKYETYIKMIDQDIDRVEKLVLRSIEDVKVFDEVLVDLKKNNVEWDVVSQNL